MNSLRNVYLNQPQTYVGALDAKFLKICAILLDKPYSGHENQSHPHLLLEPLFFIIFLYLSMRLLNANLMVVFSFKTNQN